MDNKKKAIILDMDETLEHGIFQSLYGVGNGAMMVLRPNLDELISKLQEAKKQGISIVLCTTAHKPWVERFLTLKPEFRELLDRTLTRDNEEEWRCFDKEQNSVEYAASQNDDYLASSKPVTILGYDSILFIDDNKQEGKRLKELFEFAQGKFEKDVTYFSGFGFKGGSIDISYILKCKKASSKNPEIAQKLGEYLKSERNNPACHIMCSVIDDFMNKKFTPGLTLADEKYSQGYNEFLTQHKGLEMDLRKQGTKLIKEVMIDREELRDYLATDKKYPYEGIEVEQPEIDKRQQLEGLIQTAISTKKKLDEAEKLKGDFMQQQQKETEI